VYFYGVHHPLVTEKTIGSREKIGFIHGSVERKRKKRRERNEEKERKRRKMKERQMD
jgi:hypothetical protein